MVERIAHLDCWLPYTGQRHHQTLSKCHQKSNPLSKWMSAHLVEPRCFCQILSERKQTKHRRRLKPQLHRVDPVTSLNAKRAERRKVTHQANHYLRSNVRWVECFLEQIREEQILVERNERPTTLKNDLSCRDSTCSSLPNRMMVLSKGSLSRGVLTNISV